jgi:hypothetical protein
MDNPGAPLYTPGLADQPEFLAPVIGVPGNAGERLAAFAWTAGL